MREIGGLKPYDKKVELTGRQTDRQTDGRTDVQIDMGNEGRKR